MSKRKRQRRGSKTVSETGSAAAPAPHWQPRVAAALAAICLLAFLAYLPAMSCGMLWDDDAHITKHELRSSEGLYRIWFELGATQQYYPLLHTAFWVEHKLWGDSMVGYHIANLTLHLAAMCLVFLVVKRLKIPGALLAAAVFALHPVYVESVAWITEQKNTLSAIFYLGALLVYLKFDESRRRAPYLAALVLYALALLSKTAVLTLPAAILVIFWWQRGTLSWRHDVLPLLPFFMLGGALGAVTAYVEWHIVGATGDAFRLSLVARLLVAGRAIWFYLGKLIWPVDFIFSYPRWRLDPSNWWQWLFPVAALATTVALWLARRRWRTPLAGWLFFVGTLLPVLGFLNVYLFLFSYVADHFQYLASLGVIVPAAAFLTLGVGRLPARDRWIGRTALVALVGVLSLLTWQQCQTYSDVPTLYQVTIDRNPDCWMAHNNLGKYLIDAGKNQEALDHFNASLRLKSDYPEAHNNRGVALTGLGRYDAAVEEFEETFRLEHHGIEPQNSGERSSRSRQAQDDDAKVHVNFGIALKHLGRIQEAIEEQRAALRIQPDLAEAHGNLGIALFTAGKREDAVDQLRAAVKLKPELADAHSNLGSVLLLSGRYAEAVRELELSLALKPNVALVENSLGEALRLSGRPSEALAQYQSALRLGFENPEIHYQLALCYANLNQPAKAILSAERALELAQSAGNSTIAQEIEAWLSTHRSGAE
ncbi:MAG TPA: tetratricopeptide repeat protein [Lacipirellulaceae bacterium]